MPLVHSFRLRDPWQCEPDAEGGTVWSRGFHRPTGLAAGEELWLVISELPPGSSVMINDVPVASPSDSPGGPFLVDGLVTERRNEVTVAVPAAPPADGRFPYEAQLGVVAQ